MHPLAALDSRSLRPTRKSPNASSRLFARRHEARSLAILPGRAAASLFTPLSNPLSIPLHPRHICTILVVPSPPRVAALTLHPHVCLSIESDYSKAFAAHLFVILPCRGVRPASVFVIALAKIYFIW